MRYGLVLDVDGVIADTEGLIAQATIEMFRDLYKAEFRPEDFRPFVGTGAVRYVEGPAATRGIAIDTERAVAVRHERYVRLLEAGGVGVFAGVHELIDAAWAHPAWRLAIATSSPRDKADLTLRAARVPVKQFQAYLTGNSVTHKKPHPEIYAAAAKALGLPPERCVAIEDARSGVAAAKAAGMRCVAVTNTFSAEELAAADVVVESLAAVDLARLERLLKSA